MGEPLRQCHSQSGIAAKGGGDGGAAPFFVTMRHLQEDGYEKKTNCGGSGAAVVRVRE